MSSSGQGQVYSNLILQLLGRKQVIMTYDNKLKKFNEIKIPLGAKFHISLQVNWLTGITPCQLNNSDSEKPSLTENTITEMFHH